MTSHQTILYKGTHQAHVIVGGKAYGMTHPNRLGLSLLNNILGGPGMNSRLNLVMREKYGLVYTVESNYTAYTDTGVWTVYFGCDHADVARCLRLVKKELRKITEKKLSLQSLAKAKLQMKGQLSIATDNFENITLSAAKRFMHTGKVKELEEICKEIDALTAEHLQQIAQEIFCEENLYTLIYGSEKKKKC